MSVLVTGGAGYIGSVAVDALVETGEDVVVLDDLSTGFADSVNEAARFVRGDIGDSDLVATLVDEYGIDACIHFAGKIAVGESVGNPAAYFDGNVARPLRLLDALVRSDVAHVVFSSSAAVYGDPSTVPIPEGHPTDPTNPYGRTKLIFEGILSDYDAAYGVRSVSLRYFNAAGGTALRRERHDPETHLIPLVLDAAARRRPAVVIFGDDYDTPDGSAIRDYIHVADLAKAHILALGYIRGGGATRRLNLGTGSGHSVIEVIDIVRQVTGRSVPVELGSRRSGDPTRLVADPREANKVLGWVTTSDSELAFIAESAWKHRN
jgi:UDP-glucose-4-epimerase GalE